LRKASFGSIPSDGKSNGETQTLRPLEVHEESPTRLLLITSTPTITKSDRRNLFALTAIPVFVVRELDYVKVMVKKIVVDSPFVLAFVIDEPNAI
jgi:hypothetical protein